MFLLLSIFSQQNSNYCNLCPFFFFDKFCINCFLSLVVEDLLKNRESLTSLEAIYFITPCLKSVRALIEDFSTSEIPKYKAAHVYFTEGKSLQ